MDGPRRSVRSPNNMTRSQITFALPILMVSVVEKFNFETTETKTTPPTTVSTLQDPQLHLLCPC